MTDKPENPRAFPLVVTLDKFGVPVEGYDGMTLRDYFAAKALVAMMTAEAPQRAAILSAHGNANGEAIAYRVADAMLKARKEG